MNIPRMNIPRMDTHHTNTSGTKKTTQKPLSCIKKIYAYMQQKFIIVARLLHIPLLLTISRLFCIPFIFYYMFNKQWLITIILFIIAGITDVLDGFLARLIKQETVLGSYLDPLADKVLKVGMFLLCLYHGFSAQLIPLWLIWFICSKEVLFLLIYGVYMIWVTYNKKKYNPARSHLWGKLAGFFEIVLISTVLLIISMQSYIIYTLGIPIQWCIYTTLCLSYIIAILNVCAIVFYTKRLIMEQ